MKDTIHDLISNKQGFGGRRKLLFLSLTALIFTGILISCSKQDTTTNPSAVQGTSLDKAAAGPTITSISPASAKIGDLLTITGNGFGSKQNSGYVVTIKGIKATVYQGWSQTQIKVLVPSGSTIGAGKVSVTSNGKTSNELNFTLSQSTPITIGTQTWMGCNLDVITYRNGDPITQVADITVMETMTTGAWCYYNNDPAMGALYGKMYNWLAVIDPRGLAPAGWHIPTDDEWKTLSMTLGMSQADADKLGYFGTTEGGKMKEAGLNLWISPNTGATNLSSFTALPGGYLGYVNGITYGFHTAGEFAAWWSSTPFDAATAMARGVASSLSSTLRNNFRKQDCCTVRCIQGPGN